MAKVKRASMQTNTVELGGQEVPLDVQINKRARNISVRVDERTGGVELVLPRFVAKAEGSHSCARRPIGYCVSCATCRRECCSKMAP